MIMVLPDIFLLGSKKGKYVMADNKLKDTPEVIDPKTIIKLTVEELQTLLQAERLAVAATLVMNKVNKQLVK